MHAKVHIFTVILITGSLLQGCSGGYDRDTKKRNPLESNPDYVCVLGDCRRHGR